MRRSSHLEHGSLQVENKGLGKEPGCYKELHLRLICVGGAPLWMHIKGNCMFVKQEGANQATIAKLYARLPNWPAMA